MTGPDETSLDVSPANSSDSYDWLGGMTVIGAVVMFIMTHRSLDFLGNYYVFYSV